MPQDESVDWKTVRANMARLPKGSRPTARRNRTGRPLDEDTLAFAEDVKTTYENDEDGYSDIPGNTVKAFISKMRRAADSVQLGVSFLMEDPYTGDQFPQGKDTVYPDVTRVWFKGEVRKTYGPRKGKEDAENNAEG